MMRSLLVKKKMVLLVEDPKDEDSAVLGVLLMHGDLIKRAYIASDYDSADFTNTAFMDCIIKDLPEDFPEDLDDKFNAFIEILQDTGDYEEVDPMHVKTRGLY